MSILEPHPGPEANTSKGASNSTPTSGTAALRLALAGGGTGGHVVPGMHLLRSLQNRSAIESLLWFGAGRLAEQRALAGLPELLDDSARYTKIDLPLESPIGGAPRLRDLVVRLAPAVRMARTALRDQGCQVVCGLGGFTSLPVVLAARSLNLPIALLEINAVQGKATRWLSPIVQCVAHAWPSSMPAVGFSRKSSLVPVLGAEARLGKGFARPGKHRLIGPPLGPEFVAPPFSEKQREDVREELGFERERPLILVLGGSQGAAFLNRFMRDRVGDIVRCGLSVLHQVGPGRGAEADGDQIHYRPVEFVEDVARVLRAASLVICRGGASTLAELGAAGTPGVVVPYPHHRDGHQRANARALGEGVILVEEDSGPDMVFKRVLELAADRAERNRRSAILSESIPTSGAARLFEELILLSTSRVSHD